MSYTFVTAVDWKNLNFFYLHTFIAITWQFYAHWMKLCYIFKSTGQFVINIFNVFGMYLSLIFFRNSVIEMSC